MNTEKPYIEYNGQKYEFEANFTLKRNYDKDFKNTLKDLFLSNEISQNDYSKIQKYQKKVLEKEINSFEDLTDEMKKELADMLNITEKLSLTNLYEKYCFEMLKQKYDIDYETFQKMLEDFAEEYGYDYVDILLQKVCEKVFTRVVEKKKTLPSWMK